MEPDFKRGTAPVCIWALLAMTKYHGFMKGGAFEVLHGLV